MKNVPFVLRNSWLVAVVAGCNPGPGVTLDASTVDPVSCVGAAPTGGLGSYDSTTIAQIEAASLIFRGTVTAVHAKTVPDPIDTTTTVIARVDATAFADAGVQELGTTWGNALTLDLATANLAVGDTGVFVTQLEEYNGGALEVKEVTRIDLARHPTIETDVPRMMQLFAADPLYARIASANEIVVGQIDAVAAPTATPGSEHDATWQVASARGTRLCGPDVSSSAPVAAGFAGSTDIAWSQAPKLSTGQMAVLLLHHAVTPIAFSPAPPDLIVVDPLDVHPASDAAAIEAILATPPPLP